MPAAIRSLVLIVVASASLLSSTYDPASVLIVVNDLVPPDANTKRVPASQYVGKYYAGKRGIPSSNIVHLKVPLSCCDDDPAAYDSWVISWTSFVTNVRDPIKKFLEKNNLKNKIKYIVPVYGVPSHLLNLGVPLPPNQKKAEFPGGGFSIDSFLASMYSGNDFPWAANPYAVADATSFKPPIREWVNPAGWPLYLVVRLDGPSSAIAMGLVDKAIEAEAKLTTTAGKGYFDWRHIAGAADATVMNAYNMAVAKGIPSVLNDQNAGGKPMISSAPNTAFAWGWYSGNSYCDHCYSFVSGAVGAQLTSYTAVWIRQVRPGAWVPMWLRDGITATWGATGEPYETGYAKADNLFNHFWNGYNFAEAAYQSAPHLNWMMVFIDDPLYSPKAFAASPQSRTTPRITISPPNVSGAYYAEQITISVSVPDTPPVATVQCTFNGRNLGGPINTPPYRVSFGTDANVNQPGVLSAIVTYTDGTKVSADPLPIVVAN